MKLYLPANVIPEWGTWLGYNTGAVRTNMGIVTGRVVTPRAGAIASFDFVTQYQDGGAYFIESFDLRVATLTRKSDGAVQGAQLWCQVGDTDSLGRYWKVEKSNVAPSKIYWDLDKSGKPNADPALEFTVTFDGDGIPFAFHEIYDQEYLIQTWYGQAGNRGAWFARHRLPRVIHNPSFQGCQNPLAMYYEEACWSSVGPTWDPGIGDMKAMVDGQQWPAGTGVIYGGFESHARSMWIAGETSPNQWTEFAVSNI